MNQNQENQERATQAEPSDEDLMARARGIQDDLDTSAVAAALICAADYSMAHEGSEAEAIVAFGAAALITVSSAFGAPSMADADAALCGLYSGMFLSLCASHRFDDARALLESPIGRAVRQVAAEAVASEATSASFEARADG